MSRRKTGCLGALAYAKSFSVYGQEAGWERVNQEGEGWAGGMGGLAMA